MWHMTRDTWHVTHDVWHVKCDIWHMVGGEDSLKMSALQFSGFGIYDVLKIGRKRSTGFINYSLTKLYMDAL